MTIRDNDARAYRNIRKILAQGRSEDHDCFNPMKRKDKVLNWLLVVFGVIAIWVLLQGCSFAYTDKEAIKTIVGEASNQGYKGMVCVGEVIRHNSSLRGFYGLHASHSAKEGAKTWAMAKKAWETSKYTNFTQKAQHFENIRAFGHPYWVAKCVETYRYKDHVFYKEGGR